MFPMFSVIFKVVEGTVNEVTLKCMNCKREKYIQHKSDKEFIDKMITPFMMNSMLHHVVMSWIISSKKGMDYENFSQRETVDWFDKGPWYNKSICSKLYGTTFEGFIKQARTDRYNIMCYLVAQDRLQTNYQEDDISIGDKVIPKNATVDALHSLGATFNFIDIWLHRV